MNLRREIIYMYDTNCVPVTMGALSGKVIIAIIAWISVVVILTIVIPIVGIYSEGDSTKKSTTTTSSGGSTMTSPYSSTSSAGGCNSEWIGDNFCDDINNNMDCSYARLQLLTQVVMYQLRANAFPV